MSKGTRNTDALLLPSREFVGSAMPAVKQAKPRKPFFSGVLRSLKRLTRQEQGNHDILHSVKVANKVKGLKYEPKSYSPAGKLLIRLHARPRTIKEGDLSVFRCIQACNEVEQGGLPAARLAGQGNLAACLK
jgi:hypothetical protein